MFARWCIAALLLPLGAVAAAGNAYDLFTAHFASPQPLTEVYLHAQLKSMYPNDTVVQVIRGNLALEACAAASGGEIALADLDGMDSLKQVMYAPPARRRDGDGSVAERPFIKGYDVAADGGQGKIVRAEWTIPNMGTQTAYYFIAADEQWSCALVKRCAFWSHQIREAVLVFDQSRWTPDHALWLSVQKASWDDVILDDELKTRVRNDYGSFYRSEAVYESLGVPWKRGLIFLGPPGNGKTISLKAIMKEIDVPTLYVKTFKTFGGDEQGIRMIFQRARAEAPCLLVFEDLDSLITDMNRSFFLNEVDGLEDNGGILMIGTTNHFDRLDPALSSRPSRFDRKYLFPSPSKPERAQYARYWQHKLADNDDVDFPDALVDDVAKHTDGFSFAYLKEVFVAALLVVAGREEGSDVPPFGPTLLEQVRIMRKQIDDGQTDFQPRPVLDSGPAQLRMAPARSLRRASEFETRLSEQCFAARW